MERTQYICGGQTFASLQGYIVLPVTVGTLPTAITVGETVLQKKTEFHVSIVPMKQYPDREQEILDFFCTYLQHHSISFVRYTGEFRFAQEGEKKTVIALCEVAGLQDFRASLGEMLGVNIPPQPAHVTLYTLQPNLGIGLNSRDEMDSKSAPVEVSDDVRHGLGLH